MDISIRRLLFTFRWNRRPREGEFMFCRSISNARVVVTKARYFCRVSVVVLMGLRRALQAKVVCPGFVYWGCMDWPCCSCIPRYIPSHEFSSNHLELGLLGCLGLRAMDGGFLSATAVVRGEKSRAGWKLVAWCFGDGSRWTTLTAEVSDKEST